VIAAIGMAMVACSGDDDDEPTATQAAGSAVTATATRTATASPTPARVGGTLVPLDTPTPAPTTTPSGATPATEPETVAMIDMAPCGEATYFEEPELIGGVPALAYKDVPAGTPILFPFERGRLLEADSREGAIVLFYDVKDVGIFSIHAAGSSTLDRNATDVIQGSVIGHFGGTFGPEDTDALEGYQLFAVVGTKELVQVGETLYTGEALDPNITDCLILP
jgi:hypothetical protein